MKVHCLTAILVIFSFCTMSRVGLGGTTSSNTPPLPVISSNSAESLLKLINDALSIEIPQTDIRARDVERTIGFLSDVYSAVYALLLNGERISEDDYNTILARLLDVFEVIGIVRDGGLIRAGGRDVRLMGLSDVEANIASAEQALRNAKNTLEDVMGLPQDSLRRQMGVLDAARGLEFAKSTIRGVEQWCTAAKAQLKVVRTEFGEIQLLIQAAEMRGGITPANLAVVEAMDRLRRRRQEEERRKEMKRMEEEQQRLIDQIKQAQEQQDNNLKLNLQLMELERERGKHRDK